MSIHIYNRYQESMHPVSYIICHPSMITPGLESSRGREGRRYYCVLDTDVSKTVRTAHSLITPHRGALGTVIISNASSSSISTLASDTEARLVCVIY